MTKKEFTEICERRNMTILDANYTKLTPEEFEKLMDELFNEIATTEKTDD